MSIITKTLMAATALAVLAPSVMAADTDSFVQKAAQSNMFEIETSKVALQRSSSAEIKAFAQQMIDDHTKAGAEFRAAATAGGIAESGIPTTLDDKHREKLAELQEEDAEDFDDEYVDVQEKAHRKAVRLFKEYADDGDNEALKTFAAKTLPTLEGHKSHAKELDSKF